MIGEYAARVRAARRRSVPIAHWAIDSKQPGRHQGYQFLGRRGEPAAAARHLLAMGGALGTPDGPHMGEPDELPWLLFTGSGAAAAEAVAGVVTRAWSDQCDDTGAPILPTRAVWLRWRDVVECGVAPTLYALHRSVGRLEWTGVAGGPVGDDDFRVAVPALAPEWERVVADIECLGVDFVAEAAGRVAAGEQVVIVLSEVTKLQLDERVRILDAVLALLPYGARNCVVAATWATYRNLHFANLSFAAAARKGQAEVRWPDRRFLIESGTGSAYGSELRHVIADGHPIADIVSRLARSTEPLRAVESITTAVPALMRLPRVVNDEIRAGTASVARIRASLTEIAVSEPSSTAARYRDDAVRRLAEYACGSDPSESEAARDALADLWDDRFGPLLGAWCRTEPRDDSDQARVCVAAAVRARQRVPSAVSDLLGSALCGPAVRPGEPAFGTLARLILRYLATGPELDPESGSLLLNQPHLTIRAVHTIVVRPGDGPFAAFVPSGLSERRSANSHVPALAEYAESVPGAGWLRPVMFAAGATARIRDSEVESLFAMGPDIGAILVELILARSTPDLVVTTVAATVRRMLRQSAPQPGDPDMGAILAELFAVEPHRFVPAHRATVDVWRLALGAPGAGGGDPFAEAVYGAAFARELDLLGPTWQVRAAPELAAGLLAGTVGIWHLGQGARDLVRPRYLELLRKSARRLSPAEAGRLAESLPEQWWQDAMRMPEFEWYLALDRLRRTVKTGAALPELLVAVDHALVNEGTVEAVVGELRNRVAEGDPVAAESLLSGLYRDPGRGRVADEVANRLLRALYRGDCGTAAAQRFREHIHRQREWYDLLYRGGAGATDAEARS